MSAALPPAVALPSPREPEACVAILAVRNPGLLARALGSLAVCGDATPFEVRILLNAASDEVRRFVEERVRGVVVMRSQVNLGTAAGFNRVFASSRCRWLVTLHDDAAVEPGCLDALARTARATPDAGAVGPLVVGDGPGDPVQDPGWIIWRDGSTSAPWAGPPPGRADLPALRSVDYHGTVGLLVDRGAWESVGGFDDGFFPAYHVDTDLCLRLRAAGWRVLVTTDGVARHRAGSSSVPRFAGWIGARNGARLARVHALRLRGHGPPRPDDPDAVRREVARAACVAPGPRPPVAGPAARALLAARLARPDVEYAVREVALLRAHAAELAASEVELRARVAEASERERGLRGLVAGAEAEAAAARAASDRALHAARHEAATAVHAARTEALAARCEADDARAERDAARRERDAARRERDALVPLAQAYQTLVASRWWRLGERLRPPGRRGP